MTTPSQAPLTRWHGEDGLCLPCQRDDTLMVPTDEEAAVSPICLHYFIDWKKSIKVLNSFERDKARAYVDNILKQFLSNK